MSLIEFELGGTRFQIDSAQGMDLSIPLRFGRGGISAFGIAPAQAQVVENDNFIGDTQRGGSCNVQQYTLIPHCQGTHTECIGHVVNQRVSIADILDDAWIPSTLLSVTPEDGQDCVDHYIPVIDPHDKVISLASLNAGLQEFDDQRFHSALIIRTLPNPTLKKTTHYSTASYFSNDAMADLDRRQIQHLLVDFPSVDRMDDQGLLSNHRLFWGLDRAGHDLGGKQPSRRTITELIYVPNRVKDGYYMLNLQIPAFISDVAPSRPLVFPVDTL